MKKKEINGENIRKQFFIDIRKKKERGEFINKVLSIDGIIFKDNNKKEFELKKEIMINSKFPILLNLEPLEIDFIKNTTCAAAAIMNKSLFITPTEALKKIEIKKGIKKL